MSERTIDFLGFGIAAVDDLVELESYPESGSKMGVSARSRQGGGLCTTALVAAARLGLCCHYAGLLGRNELSDFTREALEREGITVGGPDGYPDAEPFSSIILVDRSSGERTILSSAAKVVIPQVADVPEELIAQSNALFVDHLGPEATRHACEIARRRGVPSIADVERIDESLASSGALELIDHLIVPLRVAQQHTGEAEPHAAVRALARAPRACTAVTDGPRGCWYVEGSADEPVGHQPAFPVEVVDTTGCGDVFHGAYAAGIVWGWPVAQVVLFAAAAAALKALHPGAQAGAPTCEAVERFIEENAGR